MTSKLDRLADSKGVYSSTLMCNLMGILPIVATVIRMDFPKNHCCDMGGAIKIATAILPDVRHIYTFSGLERDTEYHKRSNGEWVVLDRSYAQQAREEAEVE